MIMMVDDVDLKTYEETFIKKWLVCFKFFWYKIINSYLPMHRGGNHEGRCRELNLMWLVILLKCG